MRSTYWLILLVACLLYIPFLGIVPLFDWDEINFAEISREMILTGEWQKVQVEFISFWEKPPLFFWIQSLSMQIFGVNEFAARLPNALVGVITLLVLFYIGNRLFDEHLAKWWVLAYSGSFLPAFYFKTGIIDPIFNLFIFLSIFQLVLMVTHEKASKRRWKALWGGIFIGLAVLIKGPVALLLVGVCGLVFWIRSLRLSTFGFVEILIYSFTTLFVLSIWFLPEMLRNGFWFLQQFLEYQWGLAAKSEDTGHEQPFYYHPIVLLLGCFPASIYFFGGFQYNYKSHTNQRIFKIWMQILFFVTLIIFSIVKAKIVHYSSLCYFPLTFLAADYLHRVEKNELKWHIFIKIGLWIIGIIWAIVFVVVALIPFFKTLLLNNIADRFTKGNLQAEVFWQGWEVLIGILFFSIFAYSLIAGHRKGVIDGAFYLFFGCIITSQAVIYVFIPKIEQYTQRTMIDFLKSTANEKAYILPLNYHSYAHHFYGKISPEVAQEKKTFLENKFGKKSMGKSTFSQQKEAWQEYLLEGTPKRNAYFLLKVGDEGWEKRLKNHKNLTLILQKNGFLIYQRNIEKEKQIEIEKIKLKEERKKIIQSDSLKKDSLKTQI
ncbi:MAG: glycosyltransferase family 39 protein [Bacteroidetes bacterium]|nr:MAG: glycosyltransferase family 39 protein [Bacteroidota bacterium]TAG90071.1 MAG: glycosyltransferase family 39 protein [Bacteroidota bacterium]